MTDCSIAEVQFAALEPNLCCADVYIIGCQLCMNYDKCAGQALRVVLTIRCNTIEQMEQNWHL